MSRIRNDRDCFIHLTHRYRGFSCVLFELSKYGVCAGGGDFGGDGFGFLVDKYLDGIVFACL